MLWIRQCPCLEKLVIGAEAIPPHTLTRAPRKLSSPSDIFFSYIPLSCANFLFQPSSTPPYTSVIYRIWILANSTTTKKKQIWSAFPRQSFSGFSQLDQSDVWEGLRLSRFYQSVGLLQQPHLPPAGHGAECERPTRLDPPISGKKMSATSSAAPSALPLHHRYKDKPPPFSSPPPVLLSSPRLSSPPLLPSHSTNDFVLTFLPESVLIEFTRHAPNLTFVQMYQCPCVSDAVLEAFAENCPALKVLELTDTMIGSPKVTLKGLNAIRYVFFEDLSRCKQDTSLWWTEELMQWISRYLSRRPCLVQIFLNVTDGVPLLDCKFLSSSSSSFSSFFFLLLPSSPPRPPSFSSPLMFTTLLFRYGAFYQYLENNSPIDVNLTNKELRVRNAAALSPLTIEDSRNSKAYQAALKILFLAQRFEESAFQKSIDRNDYLHNVQTKSQTCKIAFEKRREQPQKYSRYHGKDGDVEFLKDVLFLYTLRQSEPSW